VLSIFRKFNGEMPLQFILFTHDELVFDSALDAISEFEIQTKATTQQYENSEWENPIQNRTVFARLFSAKDVESKTTESPFGKYWDLTYKIPTQLGQLLNEK
jgi:hypothetical protein